jgi:hypothetical protein
LDYPRLSHCGPQDCTWRCPDGCGPHQKSGGINGRPIELIVADEETKPIVHSWHTSADQRMGSE